MIQFTHLHVHSHYSMLDGMSKVPDLVKKAKRCGMFSMALTDHGNMFGIKDFLDTVAKENKNRAEGEPEFKPIVGTEAYCARRTLYDKDKNVKEVNPENGKERVTDRSGYHLILLAKNLQGYHSLCKLASIAYTDGFYDRPRIDHDVLERYREGLIVCSACLGGEIPQLIMAGRLDEAERQVLWFKERFGDDYYIELMRHKTDKPNANYDTYRLQMKVEPELIALARKHDIKLVATNDAHFVEEEHGEAHDHLVCLATQKDFADPNRMHYTKQEWLKSPEEMEAVFADLPEALENTMEVAAKVEMYSIDSAPLMPVFPIPEGFGTEEEWTARFTDEDLFDEFTRNERGEVVMSREAAEKRIKNLGGYERLRRIKFEADYLEHLVWEGARKRYSLTPSPSPRGEGGGLTPGPSPKGEGSSLTPSPSPRGEGGSLTPGPSPKGEGGSLTPGPSPKGEGGSLTPGPSPKGEGGSLTPGPSPKGEGGSLTPGPSPKSLTPGPSPKGEGSSLVTPADAIVSHSVHSCTPGTPYKGEDLSEEVRERVIFELHTIKTMGFPGYFLIVSDYIRAAREELGVSVGPGRGSAAGSVVAYCLWITDLDPLKYDLLFERFLNPDRISLPDIDVDFDDAGRGKVLDWVTRKYGKERVAHIITYGTMATKSSIADVGRVEKVPLSVVNQLKSYIPDRGFPDNIKDEKGKAPKVNLKNCYKYVPELRSIMQEGPDDLRKMLTYAEELEDTNRQIGIHACGVIIGSQDITNVAPVCVINDKESGEDVLVTQYDGHVVENVGLIKMDFLGLKNLTIIKNCMRMVKRRTGEEIDIDHLPLDDELTYKLFCEGNTVGVFQFESAGMQKYLRELQPHVIDDLIAMNALYRPGPMDNIPEFIDRKQGRKPISYDLPVMEKYLKDTYGITVYQEQVMLLSRLLAGFTRGQSDTLRKAMGKKQIDKMNELEVLFYEGGEKNGHPKEVLSKIWEEWKKFASYAFNKSHAACYSWVAYQTAYLKAHYPAEYMAAVMTSAQADIKRVTELMDDCKKQGVEVAAPSVNDSEMDFSVDKQGRIRFGMQAISGMGEAASSVIIAEREKNGPYRDIFDFLKRVDMHSVNKKNMEVLVKAGAFDGMGTMHRAQYFYKENQLEATPTYLDMLVKWAIRRQDGASSNQMSIFSMSDDLAEEEHPPVPDCPEWSTIEQCKAEKEVISTYISGHPLDDFKYEMKMYTNIGVDQLSNLEQLAGREVRFAGLVSGVKDAVSAKGNPYGSMVIDDYSGSYELRLYDDEYTSFKNFFTNDTFIYVVAVVRSNSYKDKKTGAERTFTRLRISSMMLLGKVMDKYTSKLAFTVPLEKVDAVFCKSLEKLARKHKGSVPLQALVVDPSRHLSLTLNSPDLRVAVHDIVGELEKLPGVESVQPIAKG